MMSLKDAVPEEERPGQIEWLFPLPESVPARPWVIEGVAMRRQVSAIAAAPGAGKSALTLHLAQMVATGRPWAWWEPRESGPVLIVNREDDREEMHRRLLGMQHAQPGPAEHGVGVLNRPSVTLVMRDENGALARTSFHTELIGHIRDSGAVMVVLDPMIELAGNLDENSNVDMNFLVETLRDVAIAGNCAVLLIHHTRKGAAAGDMDGMRGGSAIAGRVRAANTLDRMSDDAKRRLLDLDEQENAHNYRVLHSAKQNYSETGTAHWLVFRARQDEATGEWRAFLELADLRDRQVTDGDMMAAIDGLLASPKAKADDLRGDVHAARTLKMPLDMVQRHIKRLVEEGKAEAVEVSNGKHRPLRWRTKAP